MSTKGCQTDQVEKLSFRAIGQLSPALIIQSPVGPATTSSQFLHTQIRVPSTHPASTLSLQVQGDQAGIGLTKVSSCILHKPLEREFATRSGPRESNVAGPALECRQEAIGRFLGGSYRLLAKDVA